MAVLSGQQPSREFHIKNLYRPVKEACDMFENEASAKGCEIRGPEPINSKFPDIEMSSFDLTLAFKNIINNAVKYSFHPVNNDKRRYIRVIGCWADDEHKNYSISIQNYGVGISQDEINKGSIFEPYFRGKKASDRRRTGSGFGLAHASQIIKEMHHGKIEVSSRPEGGEAFLTKFVVTLPVRQPAVSNSEKKNE
jgi:signal transduction histidine kinase